MSILLLSLANSSFDRADLVITNARLIDGTGLVKNRVHLIIDDQYIARISMDSSLPDGKKYIDASGKTVTPGLIDMHQHLFAHVKIDNDSSLALYLKEEMPRFLKEYLAYGVTTIKSVGDFGITILEVRDRLWRGELAGPRLFAAGPVFTAPGGHPAGTVCQGNYWCSQRFAIEVSENEEAKAADAVRKWAEKGVDAIKLVYDDLGGTFPKLSRAVMKRIVEVSHQEGLRVTAHTSTLDDARAAVEAGVDGLEHGVAAQPVDKAFIDLVLKSDIYYVPTLAVVNMQTRKSPEWTATAKDNYATLLKAGVKMAAGADFGPPGLATLADLYQMVQNGAAPMQAILAGTRNAAEHMGILDTLGTVEEAKLADLIILDGDPLEDFLAFENIEIVIQRGQIVVDNRR